jgi:hypothetical protein
MAIQKARIDTGIRAYWILDDFLSLRELARSLAPPSLRGC